MKLFIAFLTLLPQLGAQNATVVFEHVNVVPMEREVVLGDHTVVVRDGRIVHMGPAGSIAIPQNQPFASASSSLVMTRARVYGKAIRPDVSPGTPIARRVGSSYG